MIPYYLCISALFAISVSGQTTVQTQYGQCGGQGWTGPTKCTAGDFCSTQNSYYAQCTPMSLMQSTMTTTTTSSSKVSTTTTKVRKTTTKVPPTTTKVPKTTTKVPSTTSTPSPTGRVKWAGVNIAGFDFGQYGICGVQGVGSAGAYPPLSSVNNGPNGIGQMDHFVTDDGLNAFRLPVTYQWLVNEDYGTNSLNNNNFAEYNQLVQGCINSGASLCVIDMHNYARWNNSVIGQDPNAPSAAQFASIWGQLAKYYASTTQIAFGLMNEPNNDNGCNTNIDIPTWQATLQGAVNAIRQNGATSQYILIPGLQFDHPSTYTNDNGAGNGPFGAAALAITDNGSSSKAKLLIDVHQYLDTDDTGNVNTCASSGVADSSATGAGLQSMATWLSANGRQGIVTETGGANNAQCVTYLQQTLGFLNSNSNLFLGYIGWAAGSTSTGAVLSLTPTQNGNTWTDQLILTQAFQQCFNSPSSC